MFISVLYQITYRPTASAAVSQFTHRLLFPSLTADPFLTHSCASFLSLFLHLSSFYSQSLLSLALSFFFSLSIFLSLSLSLSFFLSLSLFLHFTHNLYSVLLFLPPSFFIFTISLSLSFFLTPTLSVSFSHFSSLSVCLPFYFHWKRCKCGAYQNVW